MIQDWQIIKELACPRATQDLMSILKIDVAVKNLNIKYGPLNLEDENIGKNTLKDEITTAEVAKNLIVVIVLLLIFQQEWTSVCP